MIKYKLTDQNLQTYEGFQWEMGKKVTTSEEEELCGPGWLHYYHHPLLAVLLNPIHANIKNPRMFEVEVGSTCLDDKGLKGGTTEMTLVKEISIPEVTIVNRIAFAILCAKDVYKETGWNKWADNWLNNIDRSHDAAAAAYAAADAAAAYAADAAYAYADAYADAADAAYVAYTAAAAAAANAADLDLITLAEKAMTYK